MSRISKDAVSNITSSSTVCKIPVQTVSVLPGPFPTQGSLAYDIPTNNIYFGTGSQWLEVFPGVVTMLGDITGDSSSNTISKLQGFTLTASGGSAPVTGSLLGYNGTAWTPQGSAPVAGNVLVWNGTAWVPSSGTNVNITLAGDITGSSNTNTISKLQGKTLTAPAPVNGNVLYYNGAAWVPSSGTGVTIQLAGDVTNASNTDFISKLQGFDVQASVAGGGANPVNGNVLTYNGAAWIPQNLPAPPTPIVFQSTVVVPDGTPGNPAKAVLIQFPSSVSGVYVLNATIMNGSGDTWIQYWIWNGVVGVQGALDGDGGRSGITISSINVSGDTYNNPSMKILGGPQMIVDVYGETINGFGATYSVTYYITQIVF